MHKSQLGGFIIDCQTDDLPAAAEFWGAALGIRPRTGASPEESAYIALDTPPADLHIEVQKVPHASRVHLDIETDDIAAEVARLEALGAQRLGPVHDWVVMQAPTGQRFCVIKAARTNFTDNANCWS